MRSTFYISLLLVGWATAALSDDLLSRIDNVLKNELLLRQYIDCFLDRLPAQECPSDSSSLKRIISEFIATSCGKCSNKNKRIACRVLSTLQQEKYAELWTALLQKFDPHSQYVVNLENFMQTCRENQWIPVAF